MTDKNTAMEDSALEEVLSDDYDYDSDFDDIPDEDEIEWIPSKRHKIRMNRIFRRATGFIPYPEVDNIYERARSFLIVRLGLKCKF